MPGGLVQLLDDAVRERGGHRCLYALETTLSRRGLRIRARRRADELARVGVGAGHVVLVALGNATETIVTLLACDRLDATIVLADPALGTSPLDDACRVLPVTAVLRRPAGTDTAPPTYPGHQVRSRRRIAGGIAILEILEPTEARPSLPASATLALPTAAPDGSMRIVLRSVRSAVETAGMLARYVGLDADAALVPLGSLTRPSMLECVVVPWIAASATLVLDDAPDERTAAVAAGVTRPWWAGPPDRLANVPVASQAGPGPAGRMVVGVAGDGSPDTTTIDRGDDAPVHVVYLEEIGPFGIRRNHDGPYDRLDDASWTRGAAMDVGGHEWLVAPVHRSDLLPSPELDDPGTPAGVGDHLHTGFAARFEADAPSAILGRDDGLVWVDGMRGSLEAIEAATLAVPGVTSAQATWRRPATAGDPPIVVEVAGPVAPEDVHDRLVATLPPAFVPAVRTTAE